MKPGIFPVETNPIRRLRVLGQLLLLGLLPWQSVVGQATDPQALQKQVLAIFAANCTRAGCHSGTYPQMGMNLTSEYALASIVNQPSTEKPDLMRVQPGHPESSYLVQKILGSEGIVGSRMPFGREPLSQEEIATIVEWVKQLPPEAAVSGPPPRLPVLAFPGWKVVNLPTARNLERGRFLFLIGHRFFPKLSTGYNTLWGLDGSGLIFLNLGYAVTDRLLINLGRSNESDDVEFYARYVFKQQYPGDPLPVAAALQGTVNWISEEAPGKSRLRSEALKYSFQLSLTSQPVSGVSLAMVPGILFNADPSVSGEDPLITLGLGGRVHLWKSLSLVADWVPIVSGYTLTTTFGEFNRFDAYGVGLEIFVGGHVFQIVLTNSAGLATDQYMRGGDLDPENLDLRLGFNIFRILEF